jgi:hypothetical protein
MRAPHIRSVRNIILAIAIAGTVTLSVCSGQPLTTREKGTLGGGAIGAGGGALVGLAVGHPLAGAAIGGVVRAGTGMANRKQSPKLRKPTPLLITGDGVIALKDKIAHVVPAILFALTIAAPVNAQFSMPQVLQLGSMG